MATSTRGNVKFQEGDDDDDKGILSLEDDLRSTPSRRRSSRTPRTSLAAPPELEDVEEREELDEDEEEEMDTGDVFQPQQLGDESEKTGRDMFGFMTPRKSSSMASKVEQNTPSSKHATPSSKQNTPSGRKTPLKSAKNTPLKSGASTPRSGSNTPLRGILKTPTGKGAPRNEPETPASARKRVKRTIIKIADNVENDNAGLSDSDSEDEAENDKENDEDDARPVLKGPPATPRTPARRGRRGKGASDLNTSSMAEGYFDAHSTKVLTSDRTLSRLKTPRLSHGQLKDLVEGEGIRYEKEIRELVMDHQAQFPKWLSLLHRGFNIITYGLGSKKCLIQDFHSSFLDEEDCIVVNGYFPSLTMKSVLTAISEDILELGSSFSSLNDHVQEILDNLEDDIYLLIHNIDGATLRNDKSQTVIAQLAAHPLIHLVCSIDHINAPLLWDQNKLSKLNFIWFDTTTFLPYREETLNESSLMVKNSGALALNSLTHVFASLTPNTKKIYIIIIKFQMENMEAEGDGNYQGLSFMELYRKCRSEFLVPSDLALRAQLTEFRDHKLIKSRKGGDGGEYLSIPLDKSTLQEFLENVQD